MIDSRPIEAFKAAVAIVALGSFSFAAQEYSGVAAIPILTHIGASWAGLNGSVGELYVSGTVTQVQEPVEGMAPPRNRLFRYADRQFRYYERNGRWRYEQQVLNSPSAMYFVIRNDKQVLAYTQDSDVVIEPVANATRCRADMTGIFGSLTVVNRVAGYETVALAMERLSAEIRSGALPFAKVVVSQEGVFEVKLGDPSVGGLTFLFDSKQGYNMIKRHDVVRRPDWSTESTGTWDYVREADGRWRLARAASRGFEGDVKFSVELSVAEYTYGHPSLSDDLFEPASLHIPPNTYTEDRRFKPPLVFAKQPLPDEQALLRLRDVPITSDAVASVGRGNVVVVQTATTAGMPVAQLPKSTVPRQRVWIIVAIAATCGVVLLVVLWTVYRRSQKRKRSP